VNAYQAHGLIKEHILPESTIYTDESPIYDRVAGMKTDDGKPMGYEHRRIHQKAKIYVVGDVHTNTSGVRAGNARAAPSPQVLDSMWHTHASEHARPMATVHTSAERA
jgi:hypothetical protein